jgi:hypothetical protein
MAKCEVCGNDYDKAFELVQNGVSHVFDSFECAIQAMAPVCSHCDCKIIGHGMEAQGRFYCCAHCAAASGAPAMRDRPAEQSNQASRS